MIAILIIACQVIGLLTALITSIRLYKKCDVIIEKIIIVILVLYFEITGIAMMIRGIYEL